MCMRTGVSGRPGWMNPIHPFIVVTSPSSPSVFFKLGFAFFREPAALMLTHDQTQLTLSSFKKTKTIWKSSFGVVFCGTQRVVLNQFGSSFVKCPFLWLSQVYATHGLRYLPHLFSNNLMENKLFRRRLDPTSWPVWPTTSRIQCT